MDSAPNEKPANTSIAFLISRPVANAPSGTNNLYNTINNPPKPITAKPATPKPITEPPVNETLSALARLVLAACVVRTLALVAILIPI